MKSIIVVMFSVLLFSTSVFAATNDNATSGSLAIGGANLANGNPSGDLSIGLSPKVFARYVTDGTTETTAQWYAIGTVHPGGNVGYATAQDVNNIYMKKFVTGDVTTTITDTIQETKAAVYDADTATQEEIDAALALLWDGQGWSTSAPTN